MCILNFVTESRLIQIRQRHSVGFFVPQQTLKGTGTIYVEEDFVVKGNQLRNTVNTHPLGLSKIRSEVSPVYTELEA